MQIYRYLRVVLRNLSEQKGYMVTAVTRNHSVSFPDVVDNRFTEQVDTLLESLTPLLKGIIFPYLVCKCPCFKLPL
jgi:hypothetical protein